MIGVLNGWERRKGKKSNFNSFAENIRYVKYIQRQTPINITLFFDVSMQLS